MKILDSYATSTIAPLRWMGLENLVINISSRTPYFTSAYELWKRVQESVVKQDRPIGWVTINKAVDWFYPDGRRYTKLSPGDDSSLKVRIICDYPNLGKQEGIFTIPPLDERILTVPAQGWPSWLYYPSRAATMLGWPHHDHITWPQQYSPDIVLERFIWHRLLDILGALTLMHPTRLFAGEVVSHCSGHRADIACVWQARKSLVEL